MRNKNLFLFILVLAFLAAFLSFLWFVIRRAPQPAPSPPPTPAPQVQELRKQGVILELPFFGNGFIVEYFPGQDFFFVQITEPTYEEKRVAAENWFRQRGIEPENLNIEWGTTRGIAPTTP